MKILITGGSGLVGTALTSFLHDKGHAINHLGRSARKHNLADTYVWDIDKGEIDLAAFTGVEVVVHLAGHSVADGRWSESRKKQIMDSRVKSAQLLHDAITKLGNKPKCFISASGIGYYGVNSPEHISVENHDVGNDFLAKVCDEWENGATKISDLGIRTCIMRIGVVLSDKGGALQKMAQPIQYFIGAPLGSGEQIMNWIHIKDLCGLIEFMIDSNDISGIYNAVTSNPVSNKEMTDDLAKVLKRKILLPSVPRFALQLMLGEMSTIVLDGNVVSNQKLIDEGFLYEYEDFRSAVKSFY